MKKILIVLFASLFALGLIAQNAMAVTPKGEEMVVGIFIGSEPVPPIPLTAKDVEKIVVKERQKTEKSVEKLLDAKDTATAKALKAEVYSLDRLVKVDNTMTHVLDNVDKRIQKTATTDNVADVSKRVARSEKSIIGFMAGGFLFILLAIALAAFAASRRFGAAHTDIETVVKAVDGNPERVAEALGKPANARLVFKVTGKVLVLYEVTHFVTRRGGSYPSLFVTEDGTSRKFYEKPWEARDSDKSVMRSYFFGDLRVRQDPQALAQVKLIAALEAAGRKPPEERDKAQEWIAIRVLTS